MGGVHRGIRAPAGTAAVLVAMGIGAEAAAAQSAPPARATVQATLTVVQGIDGSSPASLSAFAGAPAPALHAGRTGGVVWLPARTGMVAPTPTTGDHGAPAPLPVVRSRTVLPGDGDGPAGVRYTVAVAL